MCTHVFRLHPPERHAALLQGCNHGEGHPRLLVVVGGDRGGGCGGGLHRLLAWGKGWDALQISLYQSIGTMEKKDKRWASLEIPPKPLYLPIYNILPYNIFIGALEKKENRQQKLVIGTGISRVLYRFLAWRQRWASLELPPRPLYQSMGAMEKKDNKNLLLAPTLIEGSTLPLPYRRRKRKLVDDDLF